MGKKRSSDLLGIGEVAARTGISISAIRFYESKGLVSPTRNNGGQRRFPRSDIRRLSFILIAQQLGLTIAQIQEALATLPDARTPTEKDWAKMSKTIRLELDRKIASLQRMRNTLDGCIGCGCLSLKRCALYNADDKVSINGAGPRILMGDSV